jgi:hypothetical protein
VSRCLLHRRSLPERGSPKTKPRSCGNQPAYESLLNRRLSSASCLAHLQNVMPGGGPGGFRLGTALTAIMRVFGWKVVEGQQRPVAHRQFGSNARVEALEVDQQFPGAEPLPASAAPLLGQSRSRDPWSIPATPAGWSCYSRPWRIGSFGRFGRLSPATISRPPNPLITHF